MSYTAEEKEALIELRSFMLNEVTEPAMKLMKSIYQRSCPFTYNIEFAIHHKVFLIITNSDNTTLDPLPEDMIWDFEKACTGDILAFPVNCFEDDPNAMPIVEAPDGFGHANVVIVNRLLRTVEHFDPHGSKMNDLDDTEQRAFEKAVSGLFLRGPWRNYTYLPPRKVCPTDGVQNLLIDHGEEHRIKSTCRIWCYHFLSERLADPTKSAAVINRETLHKLQHGPGPISSRVENFIMDFILMLYGAINVRFQQKGDDVCLVWPQPNLSKQSYCVKKSPGRRRGSARRRL
jgi:hypothetical protein